MGFLQDADYDDLPEDDREAFAKLESIAFERLEATQRDQDGDPSTRSMLTYMNEVSAIASQFQISDLTYDAESDRPIYAEYTRFRHAVEFRMAQIKIERSRRNRQNSVALDGATREKVQFYIERLRDEVSRSDLPSVRKSALLDRIADFERELSKSRINLATVMTVIALATTALNDSIQSFVEAPKILSSINQLIGEATTLERDSAPLIQQKEPFKAIPDFRSTASEPRLRFAADDEPTF